MGDKCLPYNLMSSVLAFLYQMRVTGNKVNINLKQQHRVREFGVKTHKSCFHICF